MFEAQLGAHDLQLPILQLGYLFVVLSLVQQVDHALQRLDQARVVGTKFVLKVLYLLLIGGELFVDVGRAAD